MSQPLLRLKVCARSGDAPGGASDVDQVPEMWPPDRPRPQFWPDRGTSNKPGPTSKAHDGAVINRINRPLRLLVVAEDSVTRHQMTAYLESHHMRTTSTAMRQEALRRLAAGEHDLVVLDTRLCQSCGLDLLREVRLASDIPLIIVGRHQSDAADQVVALELGADDYIADPVGLRELVARIRAVLRRSEACDHTPSVKRKQGRCRFGGGWQLDRDTHRLTSPAGVPVVLTRGEHTLLAAFLDAPLRPLTRENLLHATRVHEDVFDRSIDARVLRLRRKLEINAAAPRLIRTERGTGYVFAVPVERL